MIDQNGEELAKYVSGGLSAARYTVHGKELRMPEEQENLSAAFPGSNSSSYYLVIRRVRTETRCAHGHCGVSTSLKASLLAPSGEEQYAAVFHFGSRDSDAPKDDCVRRFGHTIVPEVLRKMRPA